MNHGAEGQVVLTHLGRDIHKHERLAVFVKALLQQVRQG
jgi:hypothetical protein